jgi:hypothetical protein
MIGINYLAANVYVFNQHRIGVDIQITEAQARELLAALQAVLDA